MGFASGADRTPSALRLRPARAIARRPHDRRRSLPRSLPLARAAYGAALLLAPRRVLGLRAGEIDGRMRVFALALGARNLAEAAILRAHPTRRYALGGAAVDAAHAVSMVALAALDQRRRPGALSSALVAAAFAVLGARAARLSRARTESSERGPRRRAIRASGRRTGRELEA